MGQSKRVLPGLGRKACGDWLPSRERGDRRRDQKTLVEHRKEAILDGFDRSLLSDRKNQLKNKNKNARSDRQTARELFCSGVNRWEETHISKTEKNYLKKRQLWSWSVSQRNSKNQYLSKFIFKRFAGHCQLDALHNCTGKEPRFTNWAEGQPDNRGHWFREEDCAYIMTNMKWNDWDCKNAMTPSGWTLNALCEDPNSSQFSP